MGKLVGLFLLTPLIMNAQEDRGIRFEQGLSWQEVQAKAKAENKYIFVDCFASWCGPCKAMDKNIYPTEAAGNSMNDKFIAIKVQMDTSRQDNEMVKSLYADAHSLMQQYKVTAYPTFLFFGPDGKIVHRDLGYKNLDDFVKLSENALNIDKQYYTLLEKYREDKKDYASMPYLIKITKVLGDGNLAEAISQDYLQNYLYRLTDDALYTPENIAFMRSSIHNSKGKAFDLFYHHADKVDQIMKWKDYSQAVVDYVITQEEIDPNLWKDKIPVTEHPDWNKIARAITEKYNKGFAERNILNAQLKWYEFNKDWSQLVKYNVLKIEKYGLDTTGLGSLNANNIMWYVIFMHSNDSVILNKALRWQEIIVRIHPDIAGCVDTYANLLYKLKRRQEALEWENKAVSLTPKDQDILDNFTKMQKGEQTWPKG